MSGTSSGSHDYQAVCPTGRGHRCKDKRPFQCSFMHAMQLPCMHLACDEVCDWMRTYSMSCTEFTKNVRDAKNEPSR